MRKCLLATFMSLGVLIGYSPSLHAADVVRIGVVNSASDVVAFLAQERGYLRDEGLDANFITFNSSGAMIAPLGVGDLDVGGGAGTVGLYNAVERGIAVRLVADKAHSAPGFPYEAFLVRKDLIDSGQFKSFSDLKGRKIVMLGVGISDEAVLNEALKKGGLKLGDVERIYMAMPQQLPAFLNKAIDASIVPEPISSEIVKAGAAVKFSSSDVIYPNHQLAGVTFGARIIGEKRDIGVRYMKAYIRAARFYNDGVRDGKIVGANADEIVRVLQKYTEVKDDATLRAMSAFAMDKNGRLKIDSLEKDWSYFVEQGWINKEVSVSRIIDTDFVEKALLALEDKNATGAKEK